MTILAIDTSTGPASLALRKSDGEIIVFEDSEAMKQSQRLIGNIDRFVREYVGGYETLSCIAVTHGPGGFTGIRISLAAARGIALAAEKPLIGISTLETFAWQKLENSPIGSSTLALVDAYRGQAYGQAFERTENGLLPLCEAQAIDFSDIDLFAKNLPNADAIGNVTLEGVAHSHSPHARFVAAYAAFLLERHDINELVQARPAEAFYIRPPDAKPQAAFLKNY